MSRVTVISDPTADYHAKVEQHSEHFIVKSDLHAHIHAGAFFSTGAADTNMGAAGVFTLLFVTPVITSGVMHARFFVSADRQITIEAHENVVTSADGTQLGEVNHNRLSANASAANVYHTPTIPTPGDLLFTSVIPGSGQKAGSSVEGEYEFILAPETKYSFAVTNNGVTGGVAQVAFDWYDTLHTQ